MATTLLLLRRPLPTSTQVSALSSLSIKGKDAVKVYEALYASPMYRFDQHSFTLYPDRKLKGFMEKNQVPVPQSRRQAAYRPTCTTRVPLVRLVGLRSCPT